MTAVVTESVEASDPGRLPMTGASHRPFRR